MQTKGNLSLQQWINESGKPEQKPYGLIQRRRMERESRLKIVAGPVAGFWGENSIVVRTAQFVNRAATPPLTCRLALPAARALIC
jgi:hypothetical protein